MYKHLTKHSREFSYSARARSTFGLARNYTNLDRFGSVYLARRFESFASRSFQAEHPPHGTVLRGDQRPGAAETGPGGQHRGRHAVMSAALPHQLQSSFSFSLSQPGPAPQGRIAWKDAVLTPGRMSDSQWSGQSLLCRYQVSRFGSAR